MILRRLPVLSPALAGGQPRRYAGGVDARDLQAIFVATIYFGSFVAIGYVGRRLIDWWMGHKGVHLNEVQDQAGENRRKLTGFLLGIWYRRGR